MVPEAGHVKPLSHNMRARTITHADFKHNIVGHARIFQKNSAAFISTQLRTGWNRQMHRL